MIREIVGDVIDEGIKAHGMICHQTNYDGVMGAGVAYSIRQRLLPPSQYAEYKNLCMKHGRGIFGTNQYLDCDDGVIVANMFSQEGFSRYGSCVTNYDAMSWCFYLLMKEAEKRKKPIFIPGRIGCGIAGGDWKQVKGIIEDILGCAKVPVTIVYWSENE